MKYTFMDLAEEVLKQVKVALGHKEIWQEAIRLNLHKKINTAGKTPWETLGAKLYVDIRDNPHTKFVKISTRPTTFGLKSINYGTVAPNSIPLVKYTYKEIDLHPVLVKYLDSNQHFKCITKTIRQSAIKEGIKSKEKNANMWVYSDLVGVYYPFSDFAQIALETFENFNENPYKIFSFEMKKELNFSNFKQYYFQAVSNSSWAHEGYLVVDDLLDDPDLLDELRILNSSHGIGLIVLNKENPEQSQIVLNARVNENIDIYMLNKLIKQNKDVEDVFKIVNDSCKIKKSVNVSFFDKVLTDIEYQNYALKYFNIVI